MVQKELTMLLEQLIAFPEETEWLEFKVNNAAPDEIGEYISALSNSACLHNKEKAYLVYGIDDKTHQVTGTGFDPARRKINNQELENWLITQLKPQIDFKFFRFIYEGKYVVIFVIEPALNIPVKFKNKEYIRVGSYKKLLADHPEKARKIWRNPSMDWSKEICETAGIEDLDKNAILKAREEYRKKSPSKAMEIDEWDAITFLNKAKLTIQGKITRTAIILLGKEESEHFLSPSIAKISWILNNENNEPLDYIHFGPPFLINSESAFKQIRNLKYRYLPDNTLFPVELTRYEPYVIREALHNCIAHQDYELKGRITIVEKSDELLFSNLGNFIPQSVEAVIEQDAPQAYYRNRFLTDAMVNLNMIETIGGGIKKMFKLQRDRYFPLPAYTLDDNSVKVRIFGKVLDENYTRTLISKTDLSLGTVISLDKVQKGEKLTKEEIKLLRKQNLIEGRSPNIFVSSKIADLTDARAKYIKNRAFDKKHYKKLVIDFIREYGSVTRNDINDLLIDKLSDVLDEKQKKTKVNNLIYELSVKEKIIKNIASDKNSKWVLNNH